MGKEIKKIKQIIIGYLNQYASSKTFEEIKETAIPSYIHKNPIVRQIFWWRIFIILNQIKKISPKSILDFGCGSGIITAFIEPKISRFVTDISYEPFDFMQKHVDCLKNVTKLYPGDLDKIDSQFEMILAADVLEHLSEDNIKNQIALFYRWLKPGGHLVVSGPTENWIYKIGRKIAGYKGDYHKTDIGTVENIILNSRLFKQNDKIRYPLPYICEGFWILTYQKN
ncbi:MAG: class I SAM-dependent methyltransferase [Patescibacteria group bacterium]